MTRTIAIATMLLLAVALVRDAWAQPANPKAQAEAAAAEGAARFQKYDYAGAVEKFKAAYDFNDDPNYLFNIAQAYRLAGDCINAADYYGQFLDKVPEPPNAGKVKAWFAAQKTCAKARAEQKPIEDKPPRPDDARPRPLPTADGDQGRGKRRLAIALAGAGAAALAVAGFFTWDGNYLGSRRDSLVMGCTEPAPCSSGLLVNDYDRRGSRANTIAATGYVVGGAALGGSVVLFLMARSSAETRVVVAPTQGGAVMLGGFEF